MLESIWNAIKSGFNFLKSIFVSTAKVTVNTFIAIVRSSFVRGMRDFLRIYFPSIYTIACILICIELVSMGLIGWAFVYGVSAVLYFAVTCSEIEDAIEYAEVLA